MYRKLKRTWSHGYLDYIPNFQKIFPELKHVSSEELCDRFIELGLDFYVEEVTPVKAWIRFTLPFAIVLLLLMLISFPFKFILTGSWGYSLSKENYILNWFRQLHIF